MFEIDYGLPTVSSVRKRGQIDQWGDAEQRQRVSRSDDASLQTLVSDGTGAFLTTMTTFSFTIGVLLFNRRLLSPARAKHIRPVRI